MNASAKLRKQANAITQKYSRWIEPNELQKMYAELNAIGITTGTLCNNNKTCEWYYNGERVENSLYVYSVYNGEGSKNEYTIYFS